MLACRGCALSVEGNNRLRQSGSADRSEGASCEKLPFLHTKVG